MLIVFNTFCLFRISHPTLNKHLELSRNQDFTNINSIKLVSKSKFTHGPISSLIISGDLEGGAFSFLLGTQQWQHRSYKTNASLIIVRATSCEYSYAVKKHTRSLRNGILTLPPTRNKTFFWCYFLTFFLYQPYWKTPHFNIIVYALNIM